MAQPPEITAGGAQPYAGPDSPPLNLLKASDDLEGGAQTVVAPHLQPVSLQHTSNILGGDEPFVGPNSQPTNLQDTGNAGGAQPHVGPHSPPLNLHKASDDLEGGAQPFVAPHLQPNNPQDTSNIQGGSNAQPFKGVDVLGLKKRGQGLRSWIRVDASGNSQLIEVNNFTMMRRCDLPTRDLRLLDPLFLYPPTILGREKAIVVNLEQIRCIITADEVLLLNSIDSYVLQYVIELQRRLIAGVNEVWQPEGSDSNGRPSRTFDNVYGNTSPDYLPFEFRALDVALEAACTFLDSQAAEMEIEAYPLLDELTSEISALNLEFVRRLKSRLVALTRRVQKVRDEIERLMDDDENMAEMHLTKKKWRMGSSFYGDQSLIGYRSNDGISVSAAACPVSSPPDSRRLEKSLSIARSRHESMRSSDSATESVGELEMLLAAYFVVIDTTLNKLTGVKEYIDDTEDFVNIQLGNVRNQLIQFELLLATATFVFAIVGVVAGIFGTSFRIPLFDDTGAFKWFLIISGVCGIIIFCAFVWFFKYRGLIGSKKKYRRLLPL